MKDLAKKAAIETMKMAATDRAKCQRSTSRCSKKDISPSSFSSPSGCVLLMARKGSPHKAVLKFARSYFYGRLRKRSGGAFIDKNQRAFVPESLSAASFEPAENVRHVAIIIKLTVTVVVHLEKLAFNKHICRPKKSN